MIQKIPERTNQPLDLVTYLLRPDKGYVIGNTFITQSLTPQGFLSELNTYSDLNPRVEHLVSHMSLRLAPGEHLTDEQFQVIAADYLRGLGYGDCPYFVVRHTDANSEHIHIVVSRIARDGHCVSDSFERMRGEKLVRQFERQYGLRQVPSSDASNRQSLTRGELAQALRTQEPSARQALQEIVSQAAREAQDFPDFVERLKAEDVFLLVHLDRMGRLHGYSYELEGYAMSGTQLGRGFTLRGIEQGYGILPQPEAHADLLARIARPSEFAGEPSAEISGTSGDPLDQLRVAVRDALTAASTFDDFADRLATTGIQLELQPDSLGRPHGLIYATNDHRVSASTLDKDFTLGALKRRGLVASEKSDSPDDAPDSIPAPSRSRDDTAHELLRIVDQVAATSADFRTFRDEMLSFGVRLEVHYSQVGKPSGLTYHLDRFRWAGSDLGTAYTLRGLKNTRGLAPEPDPASLRAAQEALATLLRKHAGQAVTFEDLQAACAAEGITLRLYLSSEKAVGIGYTYKGQYFKARSLDNDFTLVGLRETFHLVPDLKIPETRKTAVELQATSEDEDAMHRVRLRVPSHPHLREASRQELTAIAHQAARPGSPPTFTQFGEALAAQGVDLRLYTREGVPVGVSYRYKGETFAARALGPEFTLRGLRTHFEIPIADTDRDYVKSISTESTRDTPPPDDTEVRNTLTPVILTVAASSEDASEFLALLEEQGIGLRLYLTAEGQPRRLAYEYDQIFYTPKQLGAEVDLPNLVRQYGLRFDPRDDRPVFEACGVPLAKNATVTRTDFVPYVGEAVAAAAADAPDLPRFIENLNRAAIKLHLLTPANEPSKIVGITYEHKDVFVSARSLGPEYTFGGLQSHFGVTIDLLRDADLVRDLSRALPETPPADPRDAWEEIRDRLTLVATEADDFVTYVARLEESGIHPIVRVDDADRMVGITYRVAGRELRDQQLGPDFTPAGLHQAYGLAPQASDRERLGPNVIREEEWTRILAGRLEVATGQAGAVQRYAAQSLRRDPVQALRTVANAQYLLSAAVNPRLAVRAAMTHLPAGRLLNDALSFAAAFRSPVAATVFGLRMASRGFAAAARARQPEIPGFDAVARQVLGTFLAAAGQGAPSAAVFAHRLRLAGIEPQLVMEASRPTLYYQLADRLIPAGDLGENFTLAALARQYGGDHATTAADLDPHWRTDLSHSNATERRSPSLADRSPLAAPSSVGDAAAAPARRVEEPDGAPARPSSPEHRLDLAAPDDCAVAPTGDPHLAAGPRSASDPDLPASELARAAAEPHPGARTTASIVDAATEPPAVDTETVRRQMDALRCGRFDLRVDMPGARPAFHRGLSEEQVAASIPQICHDMSAGATIGIRPSADPGVQLLRDLAPEQIAQASRLGFEPALTVETSPGRFDVWIRHLAPGAEPPPPEILNYARRGLRMEYGLPSALKDGAYGRLAGIPGEQFTPRLDLRAGSTYGRAHEYIHLLADHRVEAQATLHAGLARLNLPTPHDFHQQHPTLSRRESDLLWAQRAHESRLPAHQVLSALAAGRERAHEPQSALRYASNLYSVMLRGAERLGPAAAQAATLRALSTATGAPIMLLRLALGVARPLLRVFRP
ncbi:MAG: relaxase/mobilization nuclease domain-containing protein [Acidobacteria bacterium]|nr:relaxase/mobilization nuclease domain-containing protein [Acidobacteriota bacterium]